MADGSDPRVFFSAERTLLSWLRTGLTVIGLGFVVARFGLFVRLVATPGAPPTTSLWSSIIGVGLVVLGTVMIGGAVYQHVRFCEGLTQPERPVRYWSGFAVWVSAAVVVLGAALAIYLSLGVGSI